MSLAEAVEKLLALVLNNEEDAYITNAISRSKHTYFTGTSSASDEYNYILKHLTNYAARIIMWELTNIEGTSEDELRHFSSTEKACKCEHHWSYELPCRHIFKCRKSQGKFTQPKFDEHLYISIACSFYFYLLTKSFLSNAKKESYLKNRRKNRLCINLSWKYYKRSPEYVNVVFKKCFF